VRQYRPASRARRPWSAPSAGEQPAGRSRRRPCGDGSGWGVGPALGRMQPWQDTQAVRELDEQLVGMGFGA